MVGQTVESVGWVDIIIDAIKTNVDQINATGYVLLASQVFLYVYSLLWLFKGQLYFKYVALPLLYVMFLFASIISVFLFGFVLLQGGSITDDAVAAIIFGVFFGSDMAMAGGLIYIIKNYVNPVPPEPTDKYVSLAQPSLGHRVVQLPNQQQLLVG